MVDPLSITASVASILGVCINVSIQLRTFLKGASEVRTTVTAMLTDVKALRHVLQSMEDTFEAMDSDEPQTGHIGMHWDNLSRSLNDGKESLDRLENLLRDANKDVAIFDTLRRQARLKTVGEQLVNFRQEVQTYKDALQLSLQTIIL
jgi:DNA repair exonuclease SbcCD ATPase subunit